MHRFYMVHSFKTFHRVNVSTAALFLAAKVEEQPRKLEHMAKMFHSLHNREGSDLDISSPEYTKIVEDITYHELLLLETLGFEVQVEHPHQHVVKCTRLVRASKDLSQTAYFMTHNSLLLTTFCLEHRPTVVACVCIHLAATWKGEDFTLLSAQKSNWWEYVDSTVTLEQLNDLTKEFLMIYERCPSRLQKKISEPMKSQHYKQKPGSSSSSSTSSSGAPHHHHHHPPHTSASSSLPSTSNQSDQGKTTVKHKPHSAKDPGQSSSMNSSSLGRSHLHAQKQQPPVIPGKGQTSQHVHVSGHKLHHPHNHPPHPHQSKSVGGVAIATGSSQHQLHVKPSSSSTSLSSGKPHHTHHTDSKHHLGSAASAGGKHHLQQQPVGSGHSGVKPGTEFQNALAGLSQSSFIKHHRLPQSGMHNPSSDALKHRHHKLHGRLSDPHLNHSYEQQRGIKRPHSEENLERKRLKLDPTGISSVSALPSLPPLPPLPVDPPPPPPPPAGTSAIMPMSLTNAMLPPLPQLGNEPLRQPPPLPPPLPLYNPDESPPPPPPPPNQ